MSQWAEVRHLHLVEGVPKKEIARRLKLDVKTVRRAVGRQTPPVRVSPPRPSGLEPWREQIEQWLREDRRTTAKRIRRLLLPLAGSVSPRTVRRYVAAVRRAVAPKEAFVHRSVLPGTTMEVDFGESWVDIAGAPCKVKYLVATLPYSNVYFAKAFGRPFEQVDQMNGHLISEWCRRVREDETIICLGNVADREAWCDRRLRVHVRGCPGRKILVLGNHDGNARGLRLLGFTVQHTLALCATDPPLALSHEPLRQIPPGAICVHGHLHEGTEPTVRHINLTVEQTLYRPVRLARVVEQAREREWTISNNR